MKSGQIALAATASFLIGLTIATQAFPAGTPDDANQRLGTVRLGSDGKLHFKFSEMTAAQRKIENMDVYSHEGVRYEGQSLRTLVDWLNRRRKPTPALVFAKTDLMAFHDALESDPKPIDDHGLVFVPRSSPRPVPEKKLAFSKTQAEVLRLVNAARRQYGMQPLSLESKLCAACDDHSRTMAAYGFFSHTSPVAGKYYFTDRARAYGTTAGAENIAMHGGGAAGVVQMWLGSPGHSANMLNAGFRKMGIGRSGSYWTQMFGN